MELFPRETIAPTEWVGHNPDCSRCGLHKGCNTIQMEHSGKGKKRILLIGEAPGYQEDAEGKQFVGKSGQFLKKMLFSYAGITMNEDCWKINAVNCYPKGTPTRAQIRYCKPYVDGIIGKLSPIFIVLVGGKAVESFYMDRFSRLGITRWRGQIYPDKKGYVIPILHPSYVLRKDYDRNTQAIFQRDLQYLGQCISQPKSNIHIANYLRNYDDQITLLWEHDEIVAELENILHRPPEFLYFDYETTGLKPQRIDSKIVSIGYCFNDHARAFLYDYKMHWTKQEREHIKSLWARVLSYSEIKFQAQNIKFEDNWSHIHFGVRPKIWNWDTMLAAHVMDNRSGITGLKFQAYKELGIDPYNVHVRQFLTGEPNNIEETKPSELLRYNAYDVLFGSMIAKRQRKRMHGKLLHAYWFLHGGVEAMSEVQLNGIPIDDEWYLKAEVELDAQIKTIESTLRITKEATNWHTKVGRPLNLKSNKDMGYFLSGYMGVQLEKTSLGNYIVDKKALERINIPFVENLLRMRKLDKIQNTYLAQFRREGVNGKIYPFFDLHIPVSYRSSSSKPNFQNIPVRDDDASRVCRGGIYPSKGNQLLEIDYKGIEVCISACYHKDPKMIEYITDPTTDMHRDAAQDIWFLDDVPETIRFYAKNCWVFPQFYGSYYVECAKDLWNNCAHLPTTESHPDSDIEKIKTKLKESVGVKTRTLKYHLRKKKRIRNIDDFTIHCQRVEKVFWDRFQVYREWKDEINSFYRREGYIQTHLGFKCRGIMSEKEATNYQIQGTAFHCLLWLLIELLAISKKEDWKTKIIGQIHDSIVFDLYPPEKDHILKTVKHIGTVKIRQQFPWIIVPLQIDAEITPIDGSWYTKEKIKDAPPAHI